MSKSIKEVLDKVIPPEHAWKILILNEWKSIVGHMHKHVKIEKIKDNEIHLGVSHPTWAQELLLLAPLLKEKINDHCKEEKIKHIRFRLSGYPLKTNSRQEKPRNKEITLQNIAISSKESALLNTIKDAELRIGLKQFLLRCKQIKEN